MLFIHSQVQAGSRFLFFSRWWGKLRDFQWRKNTEKTRFSHHQTSEKLNDHRHVSLSTDIKSNASDLNDKSQHKRSGALDEIQLENAGVKKKIYFEWTFHSTYLSSFHFTFSVLLASNVKNHLFFSYFVYLSLTAGFEDMCVHRVEIDSKNKNAMWSENGEQQQSALVFWTRIIDWQVY